MNISQKSNSTVSEPTRAASKKQLTISAALMTALLASLCSPTVGMADENHHRPPVGQGSGPATVNLRSAGNFVILSKTGITDVRYSTIVGNVGTSPITGAALLLACNEVSGTIYTVDAAGPACHVANATLLTTAIGDMQTAYNDAAGRLNPNHSELGAGNINNMTLAPGLYKWSTGVSIPTVVTLSGGPNDVWIFQVAGNFVMGSGASVHLTGGALEENIFWQVAGTTTLGTTSHLEGTVLCKTLIAMNTRASLDGRALAQTAVTLQQNVLAEP